MEKISYSSMDYKSKMSHKRTCAMFSLLAFIVFLGIASLILIVQIYIYEERMDVFRQNMEKTKVDLQNMGHEFGKMIKSNVCPNIVSREDWKARPPKERQEMKTPVSFVILHHTYMDECFNFDDCCKEMRKIQDFHMDDRGWWDIGYSYLVGEDGLVYEGRNWTTVGAHAPWYNDKSIGISIMGDYTSKLPNQAAIAAVESLIGCALLNGVLEPDYILYGHRQARNGTECPGDALFKYIQTWPHWKPGDHFPPKP
ncbi:peptidoglycan-recognition protein SC2-like [Antedon mediterranea]|uniref:peptidoglycan-recognition protein SC2-like n=1 Tax=Antedon mediterranea TaxID=105859 RepID=UPI003AF5F6D6